MLQKFRHLLFYNFLCIFFLFWETIKHPARRVTLGKKCFAVAGDRKNVNERKTQNEVTQNAEPIRDPHSCAVLSKLRPAKPQSAHKKATCHLPDEKRRAAQRERERE